MIVLKLRGGAAFTLDDADETNTITLELPSWVPLVGFLSGLFFLTAFVALIVYISKAIA